MKKIRGTFGLKLASYGVISACIIGEVYLSRVLEAFTWSPDWTVLPLIRISAVALLSVVTLWAMYTVAARFEERAIIPWWQPTKASDVSDLNWDDVYMLVAFDRTLDPLGVEKRVRWVWWSRNLVVQIPIQLVLCSVALSLFDLLQNPRPREFLLEGSSLMGDKPLAKPLAAVIANPAAYLVLVVGLATIYFTFRQIRAKVRADSRQAWILKARELLGEVVAAIDAHKIALAANDVTKAEKVWNKLNPKRLELELMLNPSEKDHRLLMYLIQHFSVWRTPGVAAQDAQILKEIIAETTLDPARLLQWHAILLTPDRSALVSYILRLSHVVLKREWERVKRIQ
jgi:hypothetical protein